MISMIETISAHLLAAIQEQAQSINTEIDAQSLSPLIELPKDESHGDLATTAALRLARAFKMPPRKIAEILAESLKANTDLQILIDGIEIAGPGFINFALKPNAITSILSNIITQRNLYGNNETLSGEKIILEFVSANPTGPLNAVSARAAAVGDVLANIVNKSGAAVYKEFYVNDCGNQVQLLGESVKARYYELLNIEIEFPENGYHGEYIIDIAKELIARHGKALVDEEITFFAEYAITRNRDLQESDLENYRVHFDNWFSEKKIHEQKLLDTSFQALKAHGWLYEKEEKWWFKATEFGDDNDRVLMRDTGVPTYFMADIAYHQTKYDRGFNRLIDIWGPDHHGYIPRLSGALQALGHPAHSFQVLIVQQVNLIKDGAPMKMSKRAGNIVLMDDVLNEVGTDAARFFFVMRTSDSQLDFDLDLAKKQTADNPCYYVQYAHARIHSIYKKFEEFGGNLSNLDFADVDLSVLTEKEELSLIKKLGQFPQLIASCAESLDVHHLPYYLYDVSSAFHAYYNLGSGRPELRIVSDDEKLTHARLALITGLRIVLHEGLRLLGVTAPESM